MNAVTRRANTASSRIASHGCLEHHSISNGADGEEIVSTHFKYKGGNDKL